MLGFQQDGKEREIMKAKARFKPTIGQAVKMLLCAICRVEMGMEIEAEEIVAGIMKSKKSQDPLCGQQGL